MLSPQDGDSLADQLPMEEQELSTSHGSEMIISCGHGAALVLLWRMCLSLMFDLLNSHDDTSICWARISHTEAAEYVLLHVISELPSYLDLWAFLTFFPFLIFDISPI
jgi:hypothetical protein